MMVAMKGEYLVVRVYQAYLLVLRFMVVDLIHGTKKLGEIFTKLIVLKLICLVKNDHFTSAEFLVCLLVFRPSKLNTSSAPQIKAKVIALSDVKASP